MQDDDDRNRLPYLLAAHVLDERGVSAVAGCRCAGARTAPTTTAALGRRSPRAPDCQPMRWRRKVSPARQQNCSVRCCVMPCRAPWTCSPRAPSRSAKCGWAAMLTDQSNNPLAFLPNADASPWCNPLSGHLPVHARHARRARCLCGSAGTRRRGDGRDARCTGRHAVPADPGRLMGRCAKRRSPAPDRRCEHRQGALVGCAKHARIAGAADCCRGRLSAGLGPCV